MNRAGVWINAGAGRPKYRYKIGTEVVCRTGTDGKYEYHRGKVIAFDHQEPNWPRGVVVPYQVELHSGRLIGVEKDVHEYIKKYREASWEQAVAKRNMQELEAAILDSGLEETNHVGRTPLLSCFDIGWDEGALFLITQKADPCQVVDAEKNTLMHLAVQPLSRVTFQDPGEDRFTFSRMEGVIKVKVDKKKSTTDIQPVKGCTLACCVDITLDATDLDNEHVTSISYFGESGMLGCVRIADSEEAHHQKRLSQTFLSETLCAWVPKSLATLVQGTPVQTEGLPEAGSRVPLIKALLEAAADVNAQNEDPDNKLDSQFSRTYSGIEQRQHRSALHYAAEAGELVLCEALVAARATVSLEDRFKITPLDLALEGGSQMVADFLLRNTADPNRGNMCRGLKQTTLHEMSDVGNAELLKLLVEHKGTINANGKQGMTPLHLAARKKHFTVVKVLLESGVDVSLLDDSGRTASQYAHSNKNDELAKALAPDDNLQPSDRISLLENAKAKATQQHMEDVERQSLLKSLNAV
eukprot:gnl/MRDRNA2_/MRDRNA2_101703_c0_seq1.p1 gnl/MRDRNA2_/MRDRNA2_101703_c0~~gnl/MRDRNA2_/MRDRNA2_101703_c0_seq1.p1  ORF type:complete len:526 (+),score=116.51 gnl/MRDRNA2_/MRDRNA2_101703_c0_seq1:58-1635(+)